MGKLATEIEGLETIFFGEREYAVGPHLTYEYFVALNAEGPAKDIYLEHENILVSREAFRYHLYKNGGTYMLQIDEQHTAQSGHMYPQPTKIEVVRCNDQGAAIEYMIQKILEWPRNERAPININALEGALRKALE